jgi:hypothetical protein
MTDFFVRPFDKQEGSQEPIRTLDSSDLSQQGQDWANPIFTAKIGCPLSPSVRQNPGSQDKLPTALKYVGFRKLRETLQRVCICCYIILSLSLVVLCWPDLSLSPSSRTTSSLSSPRKWYDLGNSAAVRISKAT